MAIEPGATIAAVQAGLPLDPLENRILLCEATGLTRVQLITQGDRPPDPADAPAAYVALMHRCWRTDPTERPQFSEVIGNQLFASVERRKDEDWCMLPAHDPYLPAHAGLEAPAHKSSTL